MKEPRRYLITAALPYANGPLHIGHIAGAYLPADIYVRYLKLKGKDVKFICGSDEHGVPITIRAKKEGITPQQVVDKYHKIIKESFEKFGIDFDNYSRTSNPIHHGTAKDFFKTLYDKKIFTEEVTGQYFDEKANQFLADRYIVGECPKCGNPNAYGDQCEKCGTSLSPDELINPKSTLSGEKPVKRKTKNWFLPLDKMQPDIEKFIESHKGDWKTNVYGQCKSWLNEGLKPRAMTRDLDWGVKLPEGIEGTEGKVLYVWFDAPIGYISSTKELLPDDWKKYWQSGDTRLVHFIGKDNIVFHCIIFPAMLKAHGDYILPDNVPANEFLNLEGDKISTSRNWAVWLHEYLQDFPGREDELRYVLCSIAPETKDSEFTWKDYQARVNNELVAILGNFVNRVMVLSHKYFNGTFNTDGFVNDIKLEKITNDIYRRYCINIETFNFREALSEVMNLARTGNQYLQENEPWKKYNAENPASVQFTKQVLQNCLELCARIGALCFPFLPKTSDKIFHQLNIKNEKREFSFAETINRYTGADIFLNKPELLFPKIEDSQIETQVKKLHDSKTMNEQNQPVSGLRPPASDIQKPEISYDDFSKLDLRVGTILSAEKVEKADKLLKLQIDTGLDKRTVVSGIATFYKPEDIIGQKVCILINLAPRKIKGILSQGMILMTENAQGELAFVAPVKDIESGGKIS